MTVIMSVDDDVLVVIEKNWQMWLKKILKNLNDILSGILVDNENFNKV